MGKLKIIEHISLDGVIQHSGEGGFPYADWTAPYRTPAGRDPILAAHGESFDLLLGRRTYDLWSGFWPKAPSSPMADGLNAATKYVTTHRPESLEWGPFEGVGPDIVEGVRRLKSQGGPDVILWGSSTLTTTLLDTVVLPTGWQERLVPLADEAGNLRAYCLEVHDTCVSKLIAGREKDFAFILELLGRGLVDMKTFIVRAELVADMPQSNALLPRLEKLEAYLKASRPAHDVRPVQQLLTRLRGSTSEQREES